MTASSIGLGPLSREDSELIRQWRIADRATLRTRTLPTKESQGRFFDQIVVNGDGASRYFSVVKYSGDGGFGWAQGDCVGVGSLTQINWEAGTAEIGLLVSPQHRRAGVGRAAARLLLEEGFNVLRLGHIYGEVFGCNVVGMEFWSRLVKDWQGTTTMLPGRTFWRGQHWDSLYFDFDAPPEGADRPRPPSARMPAPGVYALIDDERQMFKWSDGLWAFRVNPTVQFERVRTNWADELWLSGRLRKVGE